MVRPFAGLSLSLLLVIPMFAQLAVRTPAITAHPEFEITDVHISPHRAFPFVDGGILHGDRYNLRQATMVDLIANAYGVDAKSVQGGPPWLETNRFDIVAKAPTGTPSSTLKLMLQALLADRFKLVIQNGSKPMPAYLLTALDAKPLMKPSDGTGDATCIPALPPPGAAPGAIFPIVVSCHNMTMETFAQQIHMMAGGYLTEPVVDSTGLEGPWDFDIKWTGRGQLEKAGADGISIFDAVKKQLGLRLELQTAPRPVLVVASVNQKPTVNPPNIEKMLPPPPPPQFDVAVIKPSKPETTQMYGRINGGQIDLQGVTLKVLMSIAWDLNPNDSEVIVAAPKWLDSNRFDILAKAPVDAPQKGAPPGPQIAFDDVREMLRAMLIERFKIQTHTEDRSVSAYTLTAVNPKMKPADPTSRTRCAEGPGPDGKDPRVGSAVLNRLVSCQNMTTAQISEELQHLAAGYIYGPVLDATGIKGSFDFTLAFSSADLTQASAAVSGSSSASGTPSDPNGALTLFDAVNRQLGLKLEKQRRSAPVLVIDHIEEKPTEN